MDLHATLAVSFIGRGQARIMEVGPARFGSYRKPMGVWGRFRIYRPSSMPSFGLGRCDRRHKLPPSFFGHRVIVKSRGRDALSSLAEAAARVRTPSQPAT